MSLILLFLPHNQGPTPPTQGAFTPGVLQAIETLKPSLIFVETSTGQFTASTIQYSSNTNTYNDGFYGGADLPYPQAALVFAIDTLKPTLVLVEDSQGVFQDSTVQYSSLSNTYNDGFYGGASQPQPQLTSISIDTIRPVIENVNRF